MGERQGAVEDLVMTTTAPPEPVRPVEFSLWLNVFRWIAAWIVVFNHAGGILIVPLSELPGSQRTIMGYGFSFIAGFAHHAVMVFFVLSGFLVGGAFCKDTSRGKANLPAYFSKRATRLWIVVLPALVLTWACSRLGLWIFPGAGSGIYGADKLANFGPGTFACNSVYLQNVLCMWYGGNASLWSLYHEAWYYVVFPFFALGLSAATTGRRLAFVLPGIAILAVLQLGQVSNPPIIPYFGIWLMGVAAALVRVRSWRYQVPVAACAFIVVLAVQRVVFVPTADPGLSVKSFALDVLVSGLFSCLLVAMRGATNLKTVPLGKLNGALAGFSFSLYCIHVPLLLLYASASMAVLGFGYQTQALTFSHWALVYGGVLFAVIGGFMFSRVTERYTNQLRRFVLGRTRVD